jgi:hypothetical protein
MLAISHPTGAVLQLIDGDAKLRRRTYLRVTSRYTFVSYRLGIYHIIGLQFGDTQK